MLKRLSTVLLTAGLLLGLTPAAASATYDPAHHRDDGRYRCTYRCDRRYDDGYRYRRDRHRSCWYRDRYGWYQGPCHRRSHYDDYDYRYGYHDSYDRHHHDDAHASGGYDSHREHDRSSDR
jgi:hypothetical protein